MCAVHFKVLRTTELTSAEVRKLLWTIIFIFASMSKPKVNKCNPKANMNGQCAGTT